MRSMQHFGKTTDKSIGLMLSKIILGSTTSKWVLSFGVNPQMDFCGTEVYTLLSSFVFLQFFYSVAVGFNAMTLIWIV